MADEFLKWLPALVALAAALLTFGSVQQTQRFMRDEIKALTAYVAAHQTEHREIDRTLTTHGLDIAHDRAAGQAAHTRLGVRIDELRDDVYGAHPSMKPRKDV